MVPRTLTHDTMGAVFFRNGQLRLFPKREVISITDVSP
jgi:hypothetical protein